MKQEKGSGVGGARGRTSDSGRVEGRGQQADGGEKGGRREVLMTKKREIGD